MKKLIMAKKNKNGSVLRKLIMAKLKMVKLN